MEAIHFVDGSDRFALVVLKGSDLLLTHASWRAVLFVEIAMSFESVNLADELVCLVCPPD